jgi:hypothetical protein
MAKNTIKVKKYFDVIIEKEAAAAITPGHLVELTDADKVQKHSGDAGRALPMFALEDELQGNGIATDYDAGAPVQVWVAGRGEEVNAILEASENVSIGDFLVSKGNGKLKKIASDTVADAQVIGIALTASNVASDARIIVKII